MLLAHQRSRGSAAFAKAGRTRDLAITKRNRCGDRQPTPTHERDRGGGRNARATSSRSHAVPECPPAIHPRESPAAAGPAAIIRQAQKTLTFSLQPLSVTTPLPATKKQPALVRKLWTKSLACGNPRKTENLPVSWANSREPTQITGQNFLPSEPSEPPIPHRGLRHSSED
jgi:hypothetical protein